MALESTAPEQQLRRSLDPDSLHTLGGSALMGADNDIAVFPNPWAEWVRSYESPVLVSPEELDQLPGLIKNHQKELEELQETLNELHADAAEYKSVEVEAEIALIIADIGTHKAKIELLQAQYLAGIHASSL